MPEGEEILRQGLVFGAGRGEAEAGDDALRINGNQQVKTSIPAKAIAPAYVACPASQPAPRRFASLTGTPELSSSAS